jgi:hypothetical protein
LTTVEAGSTSINFLKYVMKNKNLLIGVVIAGIAILLLAGTYFRYDSRELSLKAEASKQLGVIELTHDKMFKILQQKAGVTKEYRASFDSIYTHIIAGRYSQGDGSLMKWIKESNPEFDSSLYRDLMASIESERTEFLKAQTRILDISREHEVLIKTVPGRWFLGGREPIEYEPISSTYSKEVMQTKTDDKLDLF